MDLFSEQRSSYQSSYQSSHQQPENLLALAGDNSGAAAWLWSNELSKVMNSHHNDWLPVLLERSDWQQPTVTLYGKRYLTPRRVAFYAEQGVNYSYSGVTHHGEGWPAWLEPLVLHANQYVPFEFNSVLLNHYRDGQDSMGWHADNEPELGSNPWIVSLNFGATRRFRFRHHAKQYPSFGIDLHHHDVLVMNGLCQRFWQHALPKTLRKIESNSVKGLDGREYNHQDRVNLTFRRILPI